jgi:CRISPR-associated protein Csb2
VIGIEVSFLAGRFHGNGWNHAHNEAIPEWPPSPWRLLRAFVSAAYAEEVPVADVVPLLEKLSGLPRYRLPLAVDAHTRHYMPDTDDANHKRTKIFDAFVAVEGGARDPRPATVAWPIDLSANERGLLERLCRRVSYIGRAESWAEVTVVDVDDDRWDCWPDERAVGAGATELLALSPAQEFARWVSNQLGTAKAKDVPQTLWDVLTFDAERYRTEGWSAVPGTRLVRYVFAEPPFRRAVVPSFRKKTAVRPTVARFAIRSAVLPRLYEALALGERLRASAMSQSKRVSGQAKPVLSGHGEVLNHQHALYLSTADDPTNAQRGAIDHVVITARAGFDDEDIMALQRLRRIWGRHGHDIELVLTELGQAVEIGGIETPRSPVLAESRIWHSVTPFVPTRHPKMVRGVALDTVPDQLCRACEQFLGVRPIDVQAVGDRAVWLRFRRRRLSGGGSRGPDLAFGARLVFERPVRGPIAIGYGAHFGLGLFAAVNEDAGVES